MTLLSGNNDIHATTFFFYFSVLSYNGDESDNLSEMKLLYYALDSNRNRQLSRYWMRQLLFSKTKRLQTVLSGPNADWQLTVAASIVAACDPTHRWTTLSCSVTRFSEICQFLAVEVYSLPVSSRSSRRSCWRNFTVRSVFVCYSQFGIIDPRSIGDS